MRPQPDFTKLFFEYFGTKPRKVLYEIRQGPCRFHDLIFLNSLIHDATLHRKDARLSGERLTIPVDRDCWELPHHEYEKDSIKYSELYSARARLTIASVKNLEWSFIHGFDMSSEKELCINNLWFERSSHSNDDMMDLVIDGIDWKCSLKVKEEDLLVRVRDLEAPYYYSQRYEAEQSVPPDR
jgi:hypothetical protein